MREIIFPGVLLIVCLAFGYNIAIAQVDQHKSEVSGVITHITLTDFQSRLFPTLGVGNNGVAGLGGRFTYNFNEQLALDSELNFFPENHLLNEEFAQKMQGFVGIKAGIRKKRVGVFAKARPGVMWFGEFPSRGSCSTGPTFTVCNVAHETDFAMDVGGVVEFYPAGRLVIRADAGDTIIRYKSRLVATFPTTISVPAETKNNFQISLGFGWRF